MEDIIKIVKSLEDFGLLLKGVSETIQAEANKEKGAFLSMLLGKLGTRLFGNMLADRGINRAVYGNKGDGIIRAGYRSEGYLIKKNF